MQIGLTAEESAAYEGAIESGLFDQETILKSMIEKFDIEVVELVEEEGEGKTE